VQAFNALGTLTAMPSNQTGVASIIRYHDVPAAIDWLCSTLSFEEHLTVRNEDGSIRSAQLTNGHTTVALAPIDGPVFDEWVKQPDQGSRDEPHICSFLVVDADALYGRAKRAGAELIIENTSEDDRKQHFYACRDPEGHLWRFKTFNPWTHEPSSPSKGHQRHWIDRLSVSLSILVFGSATVLACLHTANHQQLTISRVAGWSESAAYSSRGAFADDLDGAVALGREKPLDGGRCVGTLADTVDHLGVALVQPRPAKVAVDQANEESRAQLVRLQYENEAGAMRDLLEKERTLRVGAERERAEALKRASEALAELALQRRSTESAQIGEREARDLLSKERSKSIAIENSNRKAPRRARRYVGRSGQSNLPSLW
jgi:uncharacterized glyoxalase superfamily protein PhnB